MTKPELLIQYTYDALDKLASLNSDSSKRHRFYNSTRLATETQGATGYSIVQHDNFLLAQQKHEHNTPNTTLLATDLQRSVLQTLNKDTERRAITYCPYGYPSAASGLLSLLGFNGERPDPVTGHYLLGNGYRAFNPVLMRFNSPDSFSPFGEAGINQYSYCLGDPVNRSDPSGHLPGPPTIPNAVKANLIKAGRVTKSTRSRANNLTTPKVANSNSEIFIPASGTGQFGRFEGTPHLVEAIVRQLPGTDMVALAQTSSEMKNIVYSAARPLPHQLNGLTMIAGSGSGGYSLAGGIPSRYIRERNVERIGRGMTPGILPVQIPRAGIKVHFSEDYINNFHGEEFGSGHVPDTMQGKSYTLRKLT